MRAILTENEKRIVTLLAKRGPHTKKELVERGDMSWATVVKALARLEKAGIVCHAGVSSQPETTGKDPSVYDLSGHVPLALGIDVAYATTTIILTNLRHVVLAQQSYPTPKNPDQDQLQAFIVAAVTQFLAETSYSQDNLAGIGLGIPLWLARPNNQIFASLTEALTTRLGTHIRIENNVRSYAMYKKWAGQAFGLDNFILITIRSGIGTGIFYQGQLIRGMHGLAGELGHLTLVDPGRPCRCGKTGCLETVVNQDVLYQNYLERVLHKPAESLPTPSEAERQQGLAVLCALAKQGHADAQDIIQHAATALGMGLAALLLLVDISNVIITADFGPDGDVLIPYLERECNRRVIAGMTYTVSYDPLDRLGFAQGAALLILNDYFTTLTA
jgi:predicted NBD/HSP70 family sugar kinase